MNLYNKIVYRSKQILKAAFIAAPLLLGYWGFRGRGESEEQSAENQLQTFGDRRLFSVPVVVNPVDDIVLYDGEMETVSIKETDFTDTDGDSLNVSVMSRDGSELPFWIENHLYNDSKNYSYSVGGYGKLEVSETYIYLVSSTGIIVYDITEPLSPVSCYSYSPGGSTSFIKATVSNNNYIYASLYEDNNFIVGRIYSVINSCSPSLVNTTHVFGSVMWIENGYLYTGVNNLLKIFRLSNPASPQQVSTITLFDTINAIAGGHDYLYVAISNSIIVLDITNLSTISEISSVELVSSPIASLISVGNYAYLIAERLHIIDIADSNNLEIIANYSVASDSGFLTKKSYSGSHCYISLSRTSTYPGGYFLNVNSPYYSIIQLNINGNQIYDLAVKDKNVVISNFSGNGGVYWLHVFNFKEHVESTLDTEYKYFGSNSTYALKAVASDGIDVAESYFSVGLTNKTPEVLREISPQSLETQQAFSLNIPYKLFGDERDDTLHFQISQREESFIPEWAELETKCSQIKFLANFVSSRCMIIKNHKLYIAHQGTVSEIDISDVNKPIRNWFSSSINSNVKKLTRTSDKIFVLTEDSRIKVLFFAEDKDPVWFGTFNLDYIPEDIYAIGNYIFIAGDTVGLAIYDAGILNNFHQHSSCALSGSAKTLVVDYPRKYVYIATTTGFYSVNIDALDSPFVEGSLSISGIPKAAVVNANTAYVSCSGARVVLVDIIDPTSPEIISEIQLENNITDLEILGDRLFISTTNNDIIIYEVRYPGSPRFVSSYQLNSEIYDIKYREDNLFVAAEDGLHILKNEYYLEGKPEAEDAGNYEFVITAIDPMGANTTSSFAVEVKGPPLLANPIPNQIAKVNRFFNFFFADDTFYDPNNDVLRYSAQETSRDTLPSWLTFNPLSAAFSGTPGIQNVGAFNITVIADDIKTGIASTTFSITVDYNPEVKKTIENQVANVTTLFRFNIPSETFEDKDGDDLFISASLPDGSPLPTWLNFNSTSKELFGVADDGGDKEFQIKVTADDGNQGIESTTFKLLIERFPQQKSEIENQIIGVGQSFSLSVGSRFYSPEGDVLTFSAVRENDLELPQWLNFDPYTGTFSGTPQSADVARDLKIIIYAVDSVGGTLEATFNLTVDHFPEITATVANQLINVGDEFELIILPTTFTDQDAEELDITATLANGNSLPAWINFNSETLIFSGTPETTAEIDVKLTATDPKGGSAATTFKITSEQFPVLHSEIPAQEIAVDESFSLNVGSKFSSPENSQLIFQAKKADGTDLPGWLDFDILTGTFSGTPQASDIIDNLAIKVTARDSQGAIAETETTFKIRHFLKQKKVISSQTAIVSQPFSQQIATDTFEDLSGREIIYTATLTDDSPLPNWITFNPETLECIGIPTINRVGNMVIKITATNGEDVVSTTFGLSVLSNSLPILLNPIADLRTATNVPFSFTIPANTFSDPQGDSLNYTITLATLQGFELPWPLNMFLREELENGWPFWLGKNDLSRQLSGTAPNFVAKAYAEKNYPIKVTANDGTNQVHTFFNITLSGPSLIETMLNTLMAMVSFGLTGYKLWGMRYLLLNRINANKYQQPRKRIFIEAEETLQHRLRVPLKEIYDIRAILFISGERIIQGGQMRPRWLHYSPQTNTLEIASQNLSVNDIGTATIQVINKANVTKEQFDLEIRSMNPSLEYSRERFFMPLQMADAEEETASISQQQNVLFKRGQSRDPYDQIAVELGSLSQTPDDGGIKLC